VAPELTSKPEEDALETLFRSEMAGKLKDPRQWSLYRAYPSLANSA
jgi:hypothetical protein